MAQTVSHEGIVIKITDDAIVVRILQQEACGACRAKELCGNGTEKEITIPIECAEGYREGGRVQVEMSEELGLQATMIVYVFPFVIILTAKYGIYPLCVILSDKMADFALAVSVFCAIIKPCRPILYENNVWYNLCLYLFRQPMMLIMLIG